MGIIQSIFVFLRAFIMGHSAAAAENLALRQQLAVFKQSVKRPKLRPRDRVFWVWLSRLWPNWRSALAIVQPETVIKWHRQGFRLVLEMEIQGRQTRTPAHRTRDPRPDSPHVPGEPDLGRAQNPVRTASVGPRGRRSDRGQIHGPAKEATVPDLANVPGQSRSRYRRLRLLHRSDRDLSCLVRLHRAPSRPAAGRSLQRYHESLR